MNKTLEEIRKKYKEKLHCLVVGCCGTEPTEDYDMDVWKKVEKIIGVYFQKRLKEILPEKGKGNEGASCGDNYTHGRNSVIDEILNNSK